MNYKAFYWIIALILIICPITAQEIDYTKDGIPFIAGEVIVKTSNFPLASIAMTIIPDGNLQATDFSIEEDLNDGLKFATVDEGIPIEEVIESLENSRFIEWAEPNWVIALELPEEPEGLDKLHDDLSSKKASIQKTGPNDPFYSIQWGLKSIKAEDAWDATIGSKKIVIAVIDTGIYYLHPDLMANIWINDKENPTNNKDNDRNGYIGDYFGYNFIDNKADPLDDHGHGTHVAGIIGAVGNNAKGVTGVNWNVNLMSLRTLGTNGNGDMVSGVKAIQYAKQMGANVISCSWGGSGKSLALDEAIRTSPNILFVIAAGNDANNNDVKGFYPANYNYPHTITVAATDQNDKLATFSNYGVKTVDIAAPGVTIASTYIPSYNEYAYLSGTSMATPFVSGLAGLMLSIDPTLTPIQVKKLMLDNADKISSLDGKISSGSRINAGKTIQAVSRQSTTPTPTTPTPIIINEQKDEVTLLMDLVAKLIELIFKNFGLI